MNIAILIPTLGMGGAERAAVQIGSYYHDRGDQVYYFLFANCGQIFFPTKGKIVKTHVFFPFLSENYSENIREMLFAAKAYKKLKQKYQKRKGVCQCSDGFVGKNGMFRFFV